MVLGITPNTKFVYSLKPRIFRGFFFMSFFCKSVGFSGKSTMMKDLV